MQTVIVALGDSTTAGTPLFLSPLESPPDGWGEQASQFSYWLMQRHHEWQVLNRGVNGERTDQIAARFDRDVLGPRPRAVVIIAGVNDVYQGRSVESITAMLGDMYQRAANAKIPVVAGSIIPYNTATQAQNDAMRAVNEWIAQQAGADRNITFVDTRLAVARPEDINKLRASEDGLHPDVAGYRLMADALEPGIRQALAVS
jgi:lysophospholipase L1-like esterase